MKNEETLIKAITVALSKYTWFAGFDLQDERLTVYTSPDSKLSNQEKEKIIEAAFKSDNLVLSYNHMADQFKAHADETESN